MTVFAWECRITGSDLSCEVVASTRGRAKVRYLRDHLSVHVDPRSTPRPSPSAAGDSPARGRAEERSTPGISTIATSRKAAIPLGRRSISIAGVN